MKRFPRLYLLHGKGGSPNGTVRLLKHAIVPLYQDGIIIIRPGLAHSDPDKTAERSLATFDETKIPFGSLLVGVSLGGLIAAALQEQARPDLHVICISAPTWADKLSVNARMKNRIALYSSSDAVIAGRTASWPTLASEAYDLPWLTHDTDRHLDRLAPAIAAYLNDDDYRPFLFKN